MNAIQRRRKRQRALRHRRMSDYAGRLDPRYPVPPGLSGLGQAVPEQATHTEALLEHIVKVKAGYRILSHRTGKNLGTYRTRAAAQRALARMAQFREGQTAIGACRYVGIGGRQVCLTGGHNHTARLKEGERRTLYYGGAQPGRRMQKKMRAMAAGMPPGHT